MERHHKFAGVITTTVMRPILTKLQRKASRLMFRMVDNPPSPANRIWSAFHPRADASASGGEVSRGVLPRERFSPLAQKGHHSAEQHLFAKPLCSTLNLSDR
jgi:hypothetical protein